MRSLLILRGSPGCGKSTWIKEQGLENYTLSADTIRMLYESPIIVPDKKHRVISQKNDSKVWRLLFELLEERMSRGEFVVVDATHSKSSDFSKYNKLCERYRYRRYYVDFSDVPIEVCKERNANREDYKRVPEDVIDKMYARIKTQGKTSGWVEVDKNDIWSTIGVKLLDFNRYENIHVFGDIHGCFSSLETYFENMPYNEDDMYIFCGDYLDRGIQNKKTLEYLMELSEKPNTLFLEGNHELWLNYYSLDEYEMIRNKGFLNKTAKEIADIDKAKIRKFYRKIGQMAYFTFDGKKYFISHGGLSYLPEELQLVATGQLIHGVGDYNANIDEIWAQNYTDTIQIHGHRNTYELTDVDGKSYNLEGHVEFGGDLRVLLIQKGENPILFAIRNEVVDENPNEYNDSAYIRETMPIITQLRNASGIKEKDLGNNISSFNFTRRTFYSGNWNAMTCKARGLFVDVEKDKVVARSYDKFFNIGERHESELEHLLHTFKGKITCYKKENGFLGILSKVNGELFFATKSSNDGEFAEYFKTIYNNSSINKDAVEKYLSENDVSLIFEVIDIVNDPHIIKYDESKIVLLDIINNDYDFVRKPYNELQEIAKELNCECKSIYAEFDDVREFHKWYLENTDEDDMSKDDIEGVVIENNGFMTKLKFPYYKFWKFMRSLKESVQKNRKINLGSLYNAEANYFYAWLKKQDEETLSKDIITLREMYFKEKGE